MASFPSPFFMGNALLEQLLRDVEAVLGEPNEVYAWVLEGCTMRLWSSEELEISLVFDNANRLLLNATVSPPPPARAIRSDYVEVIPSDESFLDRIRRWLHM